MELKNIIVGVVVLLIFLFIFYVLKPKSFSTKSIIPIKLAPEPVPIKDDKPKNYEVEWDTLTPGEKIQYLVDTYFAISPEKSEYDGQAASDSAFIASLPKDDTTCVDGFAQCPNWSDDGECQINPEYMLYNCAKSCKACKLTPEEKNKLDKIYNSKPPIHCVYHGEDYPGEFQYLNRLYDYAVAVNY